MAAHVADAATFRALAQNRLVEDLARDEIDDPIAFVMEAVGRAAAERARRREAARKQAERDEAEAARTRS